MIINFIVGTLNLLIKALGTVLGWVIGLLPNSPFQGILNNEGVSQYLGSLAWIFPFPTIVSIFTAWTTAIGIYYLYSIVMRWIKIIA